MEVKVKVRPLTNELWQIGLRETNQPSVDYTHDQPYLFRILYLCSTYVQEKMLWLAFRFVKGIKTVL